MRKPFNGDFPLTQDFGNKFFKIVNGVKIDVYAQYGLKGHNGLDYGLPTGTLIVAPHNGKVIETGDEGNIGYGKYIKVENSKEGSVLAHLKEFRVVVGQNVDEGQAIALSDNTGNSTGPHLHWGYYLFPRNRQNGYAGFIDQLPLIQTASNIYKGYDLSNQESMKVAVDVLVRVQQGEFVDKPVYEAKVKELQECLNRPPKEIIKEVIKEIPVEKIVEKVVEKEVYVPAEDISKLSFFQKLRILFS